MKNFVMLCLLFGLLAGCAGTRQAPVPAIAPTTLSHVPPAPTAPSEGALFNPNQSGSLYEDFRARYVGDVITILLEEDFQGAKNVNTQTDRDSEMNVGLNGILGLEFKRRMEPRYNTTIDATKAIGGETSDSFKGTGKTSRDASLTGTISSRVVEVLPDGNFRIEGTRELKINNESQYLVLSGIIRPKDIGPDNTISSTRIGDARISYTGGGTLSEKQNPAWFARLLGLIALF